MVFYKCYAEVRKPTPTNNKMQLKPVKPISKQIKPTENNKNTQWDTQRYSKWQSAYHTTLFKS